MARSKPSISRKPPKTFLTPGKRTTLPPLYLANSNNLCCILKHLHAGLLQYKSQHHMQYCDRVLCKAQVAHVRRWHRPAAVSPFHPLT